MRDEREIRRAIATLGVALSYPPIRKFVFGATCNKHTHEAWLVFSCLGWMAGAQESLFSGLLQAVEMKLLQYGELTGEPVIPKGETNGKR